MRKHIALATVVLTAVIASPATATDHASVCEKAYGVRTAVKHKHGDEVPGRNICRHGVRHSTGKVVKASYNQKRRYLFQLRRLNQPYTTAVGPRLRPAGVMTARAAYALPHRIVMCESQGDPTAVNNSNPDRPAGLYQIITGTWLAHGGGKYAKTADKATPAQQSIVAASIWDGGRGAGQWQCK